MPVKRPSHLRFLALFLFTTIFIPACQNAEQPTAASSSVPQLQVVRTWDDLLKTPPITVGDNTLHLGIDSTHRPANSRILVYCLLDKPLKKITYSQDGNDQDRIGIPLGPVLVHLAPPPVPALSKKVIKSFQVSQDDAFFITTVRIDAPGPAEIQILTTDGKLLAARTIRITKSESSPWLLLDHPDGANQTSNAVERYSLSEAPGLPVWDGSSPHPRIDPLPRLFPQTIDPDLQVSVKDGIVTVKSKDWADDILPNYWLIRWWVNGKPVLKPFGKVNPPLQMNEVRNSMGSAKYPLEFQFRLEVDRKKLNAHPDDRLEFQLLYCPDGVSSGGFGDDTEHALNSDENNAPSGLSNIARWNPAQAADPH